MFFLTVNRFSGLTSIIPRSKFWQSGGTKWGMWKTPRFTFSRSCLRLSSSNGKAPTNKAYRITPHDHTSARLPSYFSPYEYNEIREKRVEIKFYINYCYYHYYYFLFMYHRTFKRWKRKWKRKTGHKIFLAH